MEGFEQLKEQAMFYISHSPEYARQYTEFFNEHILDIGKSFYPDDINTPANQTKIALIVSVGAVLLVLILLNITFSVATKLFSGSQKDRSTKKYNKAFKKSCILLGNSGSGKTLLFSRLVFGRDEELEVHTSQTPNSSIWVHDPKSRGGIGLIDTPSNKKVSGCWEKLVAEGTGTGVAAPSSVVFVIDSASFNDNKMLVSE